MKIWKREESNALLKKNFIETCLETNAEQSSSVLNVLKVFHSQVNKSPLRGKNLPTHPESNFFINYTWK